MAEARIDKWMWAVRIFKTRTIAAEACKKGRITINGSLVKAARMIKPGDVIQVKKPPITYSFKPTESSNRKDERSSPYQGALIGSNEVFGADEEDDEIVWIISQLYPKGDLSY